MDRPIVFMFSGQGSHYFQMGRELYKQHVLFRRWMNNLDSMVYDIIRESVCEKIYDEKNKISDPFIKILYSHPAIFMVEYAMAKVLLNEGIRPDYILGTSMGEFSSAAISGILSLEESLEAVIQQADVIEQNCQEGKMVAILEKVELFHNTPILNETCELAVVNFDLHFVISLKPEDVKRITAYLGNKRINYQEIPVSFGFHSSLIDPAKIIYKKMLKNITYKMPKTNYISGIYNERLKKIPGNYFWDIVRKQINFKKTIQNMESKNNYIYLDLGPSGTLANFIKYIIPEESQSISMPIITPFRRDLSNLKIIKELLSNR